jgi:CotS family spore coat protein
MHVLHDFDVKARRVIKEKASYICVTDKGGKIIKKSFYSAESLMFQHAVTEHIREKGYAYAVKFDLSASGLPYVAFNGDLYTMTDYFLDCAEADFSDAETFARIIENMASMHKAAEGFGGKAPETANVLEKFRKGRVEMLSIKKKIGGQKRLSDIDVIFLKNYGFYIDKIEKAIYMLEGIDFGQLTENAEGMICHGALKEENVFTDGKRVYFYNFSRAFGGSGVFDFCDVTRRHAKRPRPDSVPVGEAMKLYEAANGTIDTNIVYPLLLYPEKFIRICEQYYRKKRTWTPSAMANRMETAVNYKEYYYKYIEKLVT